MHNILNPRQLLHPSCPALLLCVQVLHHRLQQGAAAGEAGFILDGFPRYSNTLSNSNQVTNV